MRKGENISYLVFIYASSSTFNPFSVTRSVKVSNQRSFETCELVQLCQELLLWCTIIVQVASSHFLAALAALYLPLLTKIQKRQKYKWTKRQRPKSVFEIVMSGQSCTLGMFFSSHSMQTLSYIWAHLCPKTSLLYWSMLDLNCVYHCYPSSVICYDYLYRK